MGVPWRMVSLMMLFCFAVPGESVTCFTCHDQVPGCPGGAACPFNTIIADNLNIIAGTVAQGAPVAISCMHLLPLRILRVMSRNTLDTLRVIARRPLAGTPIDLTTLAIDALIDAVNSGATYVTEALREVGRRQASAGTQIEIARLNGLQSTLASMERVGATMGGAGATSAAGALLGALTYTYYKATAVVREDISAAVTAVLQGDDMLGTPDDRRASSAAITTRIRQPRTFAEFMNALLIWIMICTATGLAHVLTLGTFLQDVVYDTIEKLERPWQLAHELFLLYLEKIETCADGSLTLFTVFSAGAHDTLLTRAEDRARRAFGPDIFRSNRNNGGGFSQPSHSTSEPGERRWTGSFNRDPNAPACITFNLGRRDHPAGALNEKGGCRFRHVCDHWVTDKGPKGVCGSPKHHRGACDNPNKCNEPVTA